ncbi:unnamed protein product [Lasius platythorax]|uniref:Uncharacterized protein n=1 Tax=Lasius platythorax TaxID=488582 RepID=A0AAV2NF60_9HYME
MQFYNLKIADLCHLGHIETMTRMGCQCVCFKVLDIQKQSGLSKTCEIKAPRSLRNLKFKNLDIHGLTLGF